MELRKGNLMSKGHNSIRMMLESGKQKINLMDEVLNFLISSDILFDTL